MTNVKYQTAPMSRRDWLATSAVGLSALASASAADLTTGWIDAHSHIWTPDTQKYPLATGYTRADMQPPSFTKEELLAQANPVGVTRVVLIQMSFYGFDNSYMLDAIAGHPGVFSGVAVIDANGADPAGEMLRLKKAGVRGFRIYHGKLNAHDWLETPGMAKMWQTAAKEDLAICPLTNPEYLPAIGQMIERNQDTTVVIDHFARIGVSGEIRPGDLDNLVALARYKKTHVKTSAFYALGKKKAPYTDLAPMITRLLDAFGAERLMWATDCPYQVQEGHTYADSLALISERMASLSKTDRNWLLRDTAARVFFR